MKAFGETEIRKIIEGALFIEERQNGGDFTLTADNRSQERLSEWQKLLNVTPDKNIFQTRLAGDGIAMEEALRICGDPSFSGDAELPAWAELLKAAAAALPMDEKEAWAAVSVKKAEIGLEGPLGALLPFLRAAESRLSEKYKGLPMENLSDILFRRLYYTCSQTFNARLRMMSFMGKIFPGNSEAAWDQLAGSLLDGGWLDLFEEYPVLARKIGTTVEYFLIFVEESLDRFYEKKKTLEDAFFGGVPIHQIVNIQGEISDLHQKGKSVLIFTFDGGRRLVYKPRPLEIDTAWEEFLAHFATEKSSVRAPHAADFGNYGFIEYIEHKPCAGREELETFFYNAGALMALLFAFGGNDFHMENIIASGAAPVIVDTETLMIPVARYFGKGGKDDPEDKEHEESLEAVVERSVMKMGFLPMWHKEGDNKRADYGGLTGDREDLKNLPVYQGEKYPGNGFSAEIAGGFSDMYRLVIKRREELLHGEKGIRLFERCKFRMLIRNSQVYGNLMEHIRQPALLKDGFEYSMKTDRLVNAFLYDAHESIIPQLMKVFHSEKSAVERGDIPIFYGEPDGEGILDEEGFLFDRYFERSAVGNARDRISKFSEEDLMIQLQIIEKSLATEVRNVHEYLPGPEEGEKDGTAEHRLLDKEELLSEARAIYSEIMENRFVSKNGDYSWLAEQYDLSRSGTSLNIMGPSIYDGFLGISVFAAALYEITKDRDCYETAAHCVKKAGEYIRPFIPDMERYQMSLGYSSGMAGYIAGLSLASAYLSHEEGCELAGEVILGITEKMIRSDAVFDILGGVSGLVLALTREERWLNHPKTGEHVRNLLKWSGEHLLRQRSAETNLGFTVWKSKEASQPLTGLGHGAAGIALALFRLYEVFKDETFLNAGKEAVAYENSVYDGEAGNWPDFRIDPGKKDKTEKQFMGGYCSGAPGIGLARLDGLKRIGAGAGPAEPGGTPAEAQAGSLAEVLAEDVRRTDRFVRSIRNEGRNHLCCGGAGRIDFLIEAGFRLNGRDVTALAHSKLSDLVLGRQQRGHYNFHVVNGKYYYNPTLFQGTAGVGYEILRFLAPEKIKSVLI